MDRKISDFVIKNNKDCLAVLATRNKNQHYTRIQRHLFWSPMPRSCQRFLLSDFLYHQTFFFLSFLQQHNNITNLRRNRERTKKFMIKKMRSRQLSCERRMNISTGAGLITPYNTQNKIQKEINRKYLYIYIAWCLEALLLLFYIIISSEIQIFISGVLLKVLF